MRQRRLRRRAVPVALAGANMHDITDGDLSLLRRPAVAIVGSRDHTVYGAEVARALAWGLGSGGIVVVSGPVSGVI